MMPDELPSNDFHEIAYRLAKVRDDLEEVDDDYSRQEIYDRISTSATIINDVIADMSAIERVIQAVIYG